MIKLPGKMLWVMGDDSHPYIHLADEILESKELKQAEQGIQDLCSWLIKNGYNHVGIDDLFTLVCGLEADGMSLSVNGNIRRLRRNAKK